MSPARQALRGLGIVVTRPAPQAAALARLIEDAGGQALQYPMIQIVPATSAALEALVDALDRYDLAIFISRNAVEQGLARIADRRVWPHGLAIAAVGGATRAALEARGFLNVLAPPDDGGSESLLQALASSAMAAEGKHIVIFRGIGGREYLRSALLERGAIVEYAECYSRKIPPTDMRPLIARWARGRVHAVTVSSGEALENFAAALAAEERELFTATPLFVPHPRVAETASRLGIARAVVAGPADEDLVRAMVAYFCRAG